MTLKQLLVLSDTTPHGWQQCLQFLCKRHSLEGSDSQQLVYARPEPAFYLNHARWCVTPTWQANVSRQAYTQQRNFTIFVNKLLTEIGLLIKAP